MNAKRTNSPTRIVVVLVATLATAMACYVPEQKICIEIGGETNPGEEGESGAGIYVEGEWWPHVLRATADCYVDGVKPAAPMQYGWSTPVDEDQQCSASGEYWKWNFVFNTAEGTYTWLLMLEDDDVEIETTCPAKKVVSDEDCNGYSGS